MKGCEIKNASSVEEITARMLGKERQKAVLKMWRRVGGRLKMLGLDRMKCREVKR